MEGISDIRIIGLDESRPPMITKSPYIDVYFKLSHKVPEDWCNRFNDLVARNTYKPRMDQEDRLYINTWVRKASEIPAMLAQLIEQVDRCNKKHIDAVMKARRAASSSPTGTVSPQQAELDEIVAGLSFEGTIPSNPSASGQA
jgi:hypothetical protein